MSAMRNVTATIVGIITAIATVGDVTLNVPRLKNIPFETAIIELYSAARAVWRRS